MKFYVVARNPLDFYHQASVPLVQWIGSDARNLETALWAMASATKHPWWEFELQSDPVVIHDVASDVPIFLFKLSNNGTTILVCEHQLSLGSEAACPERDLEVSFPSPRWIDPEYCPEERPSRRSALQHQVASWCWRRASDLKRGASAVRAHFSEGPDSMIALGYAVQLEDVARQLSVYGAEVRAPAATPEGLQ